MSKIGTYKEMIDDMEAGVFDFTENGHCSGCGQCCTNYLPMSEFEVRRIKAYVKRHAIKEQIHFIPTAVPSFDFTCPFRNNREKQCEIYEVRPAICRDFKCDKPSKGEWADANLYSGKMRLVRVRETFFGKEVK